MKTLFILILLSIPTLCFAAKPFCVGDVCCGTFQNRADRVQIRNCPQLEEALSDGVPITTPAPTPAPTAVVTPAPTGSAIACQKLLPGSGGPDELSSKENEVLEIGVPRYFCFDVPTNTSPTKIIEINTVNRGNASCSNVNMEAWTPRGALPPSSGPAPATSGFAVPGRWLFKVTQTSGDCFRYKFGAKL